MRSRAHSRIQAVTQSAALFSLGSWLLCAGGCGGELDRGESLGQSAARIAVEASPALGSLKGVAVPKPSNLSDFIKDEQAAIALGKALFWDTQAGSDGQACASCHFHAGADHRRKNQLNPGQRNQLGPPVSQTFNPTGSGDPGGPNHELKSADFPFHRLADVNDRDSTVLFDTDDVFSSQGVFRASFQALDVDSDKDECVSSTDLVFHVGNVNVRRVSTRQAPTVINAAFNFRNTWDGRTNNVFNGVNPAGERSPDAFIHVVHDGQVIAVRVALFNSSLASQSVGPVNDAAEMACANRTFPVLGQKLLKRRPLHSQEVDPTDSVLGSLRHPSGKGLQGSYERMIKDAFRRKFWDSSEKVNGFSLMAANFSLFWGLALQVYQSTLVSDDSPFDRFMDGDLSALTATEQAGLSLFQDKAHCVRCHNGPELTTAATRQQAQNQQGGLVNRMIMGDGTPALYDRGFYNIGVRPTGEDIGLGGTDPFGNPISFTRQAKLEAAGGTTADPFFVDPGTFQVGTGQPIRSDERDAVNGAFKVPTLRNVSLTAPYFHNGGQATLAQVVAFYNRGGDRRGPPSNDTTGFDANPTNLDPSIEPLGLTQEEQAALVAFLQSLTDPRVRNEMAPFDHPALLVPNGHPGDATSVTPGQNGQAKDVFLQIPAVGALGRGPKGLPPLKNLF